MKQGNGNYARRFLCFLLVFAMLITAGGFDSMTGMVKKASAATAISLENIRFYDDISGSPTPVQGSIRNGDKESIIHMDVSSALTFDINAGSAKWKAYLADANHTPLGEEKLYFTNDENDNSPTAVTGASREITYSDLGIKMKKEDNGLRITTGTNLNKNTVYYLYVGVAKDQNTYVFARIYLYNPVEKMIIRGEPDITVPRKRSWYIPTSGQDNNGLNAWKTKSGVTETTDNFTWTISEKPKYEVVKDSIKLTKVTPVSGRAAQADLQTAAISAPDKVTISAKVDDGIKQTAGAVEIKAMRDREQLAPETFTININKGNPSRQIKFINNPAYYKKTENGYSLATEEDIAKGTGLPTYEVKVKQSFALRPNMEHELDDQNASATDEFAWKIDNSSSPILSIDEDGTVTGKSSGYAKVTVTGDDPAVTAECYIHVYTEADNLTLYRNRVDQSTRLTTDSAGNNTLSVRGKAELTIYVEETAAQTGTSMPDENLIIESADKSMLEVIEIANTDKSNIKKFTFRVLKNVSTTTEKEIHITTKRVNDRGQQITGLSAALKVYINPALSSSDKLSLKLGSETVETEEVKIYYDGKTNTSTNQPKSFDFTVTASNSVEGLIDQYDWEVRDENDSGDEKNGENYKWTTEDNRICIVPYSTGRFLLRARSHSNPDLIKEVIVYVARQAESLAITDPSSRELYLTPGESYDLAYTMQPGEADEDIEWITDPAWENTSEAAVVVENGKIQVKKDYDKAVKVIAKTKYSGKQAECIVNIYQIDSLEIQDSGGDVLPGFEAIYNETSNQILTIEVKDTRGNMVNEPDVVWESLDPDVARVEKRDMTHAVLSFTGVGETQITAACGGKTTTMDIKVSQKEIGKVNMKSIQAQTFRGDAITPVVELTDKNETLQPGVDYDLEYENNVNASSNAKIILTGRGNYTGTSEKQFTINRASLDNVTFSQIPDQYSSNMYLMPEPEMFLGSYRLQPYLLDAAGNYVLNDRGERQELDCQLKYENNYAPGTASLTITGIGNFTGTKTLSFNIRDDKSYTARATKVRIEPIGSAVYEGTQAIDSSAFYIADGDRIYINTGKTNVARFKITAESDTGNCDDVVYASTSSAGSTFFKSETSTANAATGALVTIEGKKAGSGILNICAMSGNIQKQISVVVLQPATDMQIMARIDNKDTDVTDSTIDMIENHTIQFSTRYNPSDSTDTAVWEVDNPEIAAISETGLLTAKKEGNVFVTVKIADSKVSSNLLSKTVSVHITKNSPATNITLDQNAASTKAEEKKESSVTVLPADNPEEKHSAKPAKATLSKVRNVKKKSMKITWKKVSGADGYQVAYGTRKNFKGAKKKVLKKTSLTVKKLKKKKTYYVRVRAYKTVGGKKNYGAWSASKKVKIKK